MPLQPTYSGQTTSFLINTDGVIVNDHEQKAAILWNSFKDRIGMEEMTACNFNITRRNNEVNMEELELPLSYEEIDDVIKHMPNDKSPGPEGFHGLFMKKNRHIIKNSFYKLIKDFQEENIDLSPINSAYIALIPKKENPKTPDDFRPISLVSMPIKIHTKLLANRAQNVIIPMVSINQ